MSRLHLEKLFFPLTLQDTNTHSEFSLKSFFVSPELVFNQCLV